MKYSTFISNPRNFLKTRYPHPPLFVRHNFSSSTLFDKNRVPFTIVAMNTLIFLLALVQFVFAMETATFKPKEIIELVAIDVISKTVEGAVAQRSIVTVRDATDLCDQLGALTSSPAVHCCERDNNQLLHLCTPLDTASKLFHRLTCY